MLELLSFTLELGKYCLVLLSSCPFIPFQNYVVLALVSSGTVRHLIFVRLQFMTSQCGNACSYLVELFEKKQVSFLRVRGDTL